MIKKFLAVEDLNKLFLFFTSKVIIESSEWFGFNCFIDVWQGLGNANSVLGKSCSLMC